MVGFEVKLLRRRNRKEIKMKEIRLLYQAVIFICYIAVSAKVYKERKESKEKEPQNRLWRMLQQMNFTLLSIEVLLATILSCLW